MTHISEAAIEAAARAHHDAFNSPSLRHSRQEAKVILEAAAPLIAAQALRDAGDAWWQRMDVTDCFGPWKWLKDRAAELGAKS